MDIRKRFVLGGMGLAVAVVLAGPAAAQDANFGRSVWLSQANCADCHGWMGDGNPEDPRSPKGADLRQTTLNADQLVEVILCGRPGTPMPHYDHKAYEDDRCYGVTAADLGDQTPMVSQNPLTQRHAKGLAAFILSEFAGKGPATQADCHALLGPDSARCSSLPVN